MSFRFHAAAQQVVLVQVKVENRDQASFPLPVHLSLSLLSCFILSDPSMPASGEVAGLGTALIFCAAGDATGPSFARLSLVDDFFSLEPTGLGSIICHCQALSACHSAVCCHSAVAVCWDLCAPEIQTVCCLLGAES